MDLGNPKSPFLPIHPTDKTDVANRLALAGLAIAYVERRITLDRSCLPLRSKRSLRVLHWKSPSSHWIVAGLKCAVKLDLR